MTFTSSLLNKPLVPASRLFVAEPIQFPSRILPPSAFDNYRSKISLKLPSLVALKGNIDSTGKGLLYSMLSVIKGLGHGSGLKA